MAPSWHCLGAAVKAFFYKMKNGRGKGFDSYCQPQMRLVSGLSVIASETIRDLNLQSKVWIAWSLGLLAMPQESWG
jgi:hypothetical protein